MEKKTEPVFLDYRKSVSENAEQYYEESKKAKHKLAGLKKALEDTQKKIEQLREKQELECERSAPAPVKTSRERRWFDKFHNFTSSDGFLVVGGKDATTNEILIKKHLEPSDLVFHAEIHGAPFFVVKNPDKKDIPEKTIFETAQAAASYSKAWKLRMGSCDVYYVKPDQVSKTAPSGEFIGKGAFMIHGKKEWMRGMRLEAAIGFVLGDADAEVVGGPESAVESLTNRYVKIGPGDEKSGRLAKAIRDAAAKKASREDAEKIRRAALDDIQVLLPGGCGKIAS